MQIKRNATVMTADNHAVGHVERVVVDPVKQQVTHIVVEKGFLFTEDKVVPIDMVESANEDGVRLRVDAGNLDKVSPFEETHYVRIEDGQRVENARGADLIEPPSYYYYPPIGIGMPAYPLSMPEPVVAETEQHIPEGTIALKEGAKVIASDGKHVGHVEQVLTDTQAGHVTDFVISQGVLFKEKKRVPMHWVSDMHEDEVHLAVPSSLLEKLQAYQN